MAKEGNRSTTSAHHGREGWKQWRQDNSKAAEKSTAIRTWIPVLRNVRHSPETSVDEDLLTVSDDFKSFISELRPDPGSSWGYLVVPRMHRVGFSTVEGRQVVVVPNNASASIEQVVVGAHDRRLSKGDPAIDAGARALIPLDEDHSGWPIRLLDEIHDPYSKLLNDSGKLLETYDYITKEPNSSREARRPQAKGAVDNLRRKTIDVSPGISRAIELMIKAGRVDEVRGILEKLQPELAAEMEIAFPEGKVVGCAWHCNSGMPTKPGILHLDVWMHSTKLEICPLGTKKTPTLVRTWDAGGLNHCGPGSGICAWDRHMSALGEEMEKLAPGICYEVRRAIKSHEKRAKSRKRPGSANRDIRLHRKFDELMRRDLPSEFVEAGMAAYREHLRGVYKGGDFKVLQAAADPEKFDKRKKFLENSMQELARREAAHEKKLARMAKESGELVADHVKQERGRQWVRQKSKSRKLGRKIGALLAEASTTKNDAVRTINEAIQTEVHADEVSANVEQLRMQLDVDRENFFLQSERLKEDARLLQKEIEQERREARLNGLKDARRVVLGADVAEPPAMTAEQLGAVFQNEIVDHVDMKVIQKLDDARRRLAGEDVSIAPARSLEEVEKGISDVLKIREKNAVVSGMRAAYQFLNKGADPEGTTSAEIWKEIRKSITITVSDKLKGVLRRLRPNHDSTATTFEKLDDEIAAGFDAFETRARESGLEEARKALVGSDAPVLENANEGTLRESIQIAVEQLKSKAKTEIAEAVIGKNLEKVIAEGKDSVELVGMEFARLKKVEAEAKMIAETAPQMRPNTPLGKALSELRKLLKIDGPPDGKGGYGD